MSHGHRFWIGCAVCLGLTWSMALRGQEADFGKHYREIQERLKKQPDQVTNEAVHRPPMIAAAASDLGENEPVIGVTINNEARAYPLIMLFGGAGIFELLNDTCGGQPIATSW